MLSVPRSVVPPLTILQVSAAVASAFGVPLGGILQPRRAAPRVARARQAAAYLAHVAGGLTIPEVAQGLGRDRTTIIHACGMVEDRRDDPRFDAAIGCLERAMRLAAESGGLAGVQEGAR